MRYRAQFYMPNHQPSKNSLLHLLLTAPPAENTGPFCVTGDPPSPQAGRCADPRSGRDPCPPAPAPGSHRRLPSALRGGGPGPRRAFPAAAALSLTPRLAPLSAKMAAAGHSPPPALLGAVVRLLPPPPPVPAGPCGAAGACVAAGRTTIPVVHGGAGAPARRGQGEEAEAVAGDRLPRPGAAGPGRAGRPPCPGTTWPP